MERCHAEFLILFLSCYQADIFCLPSSTHLSNSTESRCHVLISHHPSKFFLKFVSAAPIDPYRLRDGEAKM